jgi:hypothetical protein
MVFNYVTTPAWWPIYHPTSKKVEPFVTHSLRVRESTVETCILDSIGLLKFVIHWTGAENDGRTRFKMEGSADELGGAEGVITYNLREENGATVFERIFSYEIGGIFGQLFEKHTADPSDKGSHGIRPADEDLLAELQAFTKPIDLVDKLIVRDGHESLDNVKAILESMPC